MPTYSGPSESGRFIDQERCINRGVGNIRGVRKVEANRTFRSPIFRQTTGMIKDEMECGQGTNSWRFRIFTLRVIAAGAVVAVGGCGDDVTAPDPMPAPPPPIFRSASVKANPVMTISASVDVTALNFDSLRIEYWRPGGQHLSSPAFAFENDSVVTVPVLGLDTMATYNIELNLYSDSANGPVDTLVFISGALPDWIPSVSGSGTDTTAGFMTLSLPQGAVIVDNTGRTVWYREFPNGVLNSFQAHANNTYTILGARDTSSIFTLLDVLGAEIGRIGCVGGLTTRFHDVRILEGGDYWVMCNRTVEIPVTLGTATVISTVIQHVGADGTPLFEWDALDHFSLSDIGLSEIPAATINFTHGNSLDLSADGNLLVSFRSLNEITKINSITGEVIWRLGGLASDFTFPNDTAGPVHWPHGLRAVGPNEIQLLDNSASAPSRLIRFQLDLATLTAELTLDFRYSPTTWTFVGGATQVYANGHSLVTFGRAGKVVEVNEEGNRAWELVGLDGIYVFRAQRIGSLYEPGIQ